jgi:drug/metabolite transporter (DMT)-like permease
MDNLRGAMLMVFAMLSFAITDMLIKLLGGSVPALQVIGLTGAGGALIFGTIARYQGQPLITRAFLAPTVLLRNAGELVGVFGYLGALMLMPISTVSAILQASPLMVALGAALFLGEKVGWRRWSAIIAGFLGVLLIIRPGTESFDYRAVLAIIGVAGLSLRDLATRRVPSGISSAQLAFFALALQVPFAILMSWATGQGWLMPTPGEWAVLAVTLGVIGLAYYAIVGATRIGELSHIAPFRYSRIIFAIVIGVTVFGERPDAATLTGSAIVVGAGLFTMLRERKRQGPA